MTQVPKGGDQTAVFVAHDSSPHFGSLNHTVWPDATLRLERAAASGFQSLIPGAVGVPADADRGAEARGRARDWRALSYTSVTSIL